MTDELTDVDQEMSVYNVPRSQALYDIPRPSLSWASNINTPDSFLYDRPRA